MALALFDGLTSVLVVARSQAINALPIAVVRGSVGTILGAGTALVIVSTVYLTRMLPGEGAAVLDD
jgi:hypothetical protein